MAFLAETILLSVGRLTLISQIILRQPDTLCGCLFLCTNLLYSPQTGFFWVFASNPGKSPACGVPACSGAICEEHKCYNFQ